MVNPYAPSSIEDQSLTPEANRVKLYSPGQVAWASFLGSILGGAMLMAINFHRMSQPAAKQKTIVAGVLGTIALVAVAFIVPENVPSIVFTIAAVVSMQQIAKSVQGDALDEHLSRGGWQASSWGATGVGLLAALVLLLCLFASAFALFMIFPDWFVE